MQPTVRIALDALPVARRECLRPVPEQPALSFAVLLRRLRAEARLTQEELAEAAGPAVGQRPRTGHSPDRPPGHRGSAGRRSGPGGRSAGSFVAAARGRAPAAEVRAAEDAVPPAVFAAAATRTLPRDMAGFAGRQAELRAGLVGGTAGIVGRERELSWALGALSGCWWWAFL